MILFTSNLPGFYLFFMVYFPVVFIFRHLCFRKKECFFGRIFRFFFIFSLVAYRTQFSEPAV
jgi:hypothetical protein